ncbi:diacylglycerol kinase family protein [Halobacillus litoralis]|uniref:diacylglycerol kinase family protein n=1 Tax=Halobacillus litoralis TaxID=45668 RepID=UPI001CFC782C|nr:diacylglycerol kinase family protein [Halobacillus litoralis]
MNSDSSVRKKKKSIGFRYAWNGLTIVWKTERNFRIHLSAAVLVLLAAVILGLSAVEWAVLIITISLVLALEMINTIVEKLLDYLAPEQHPVAGAVKDISAGAVLVVSIGSVFTGAIIFLPKILSFL